MGCIWLYWAVLSCIGLYRAALGCNELYCQGGQGCPGGQGDPCNLGDTGDSGDPGGPGGPGGPSGTGGPGSPERYVLKIHFFIEFGLKMIQFKTKSKIFIQKNIHSIESRIFNRIIHS